MFVPGGMTCANTANATDVPRVHDERDRDETIRATA